MRENNINILQHDNAPVHTAKKIKELLDFNNCQLLKWPALSPDLNPIENVWGYIKKQLKESISATSSIEDVKNKTIDLWNNISQKMLISVVVSMRARLRQVIEKQGESTKY